MHWSYFIIFNNLSDTVLFIIDYKSEMRYNYDDEDYFFIKQNNHF